MTDKHPDCEYRCQLKEHKDYADCIHAGVCFAQAVVEEELDESSLEILEEYAVGNK